MKRKNIAFIPLRGGSKGIPNKNFKSFCGSPLFIWALSACQVAGIFDKIVIASDCPEVKEFLEFGGNGNDLGVEYFERSLLSCTDTATTESAMLEYVWQKEDVKDNDLIWLIQATNPFIRAYDLHNAHKKYIQIEEENIGLNNLSMLSVCETDRFYWNNIRKPINYDYKERKRRQDFTDRMLYIENGSFYVCTVDNLLKSQNRLSDNIEFFIMPDYSQHEIDTEEDWFLCENLFKKHLEYLIFEEDNFDQI